MALLITGVGTLFYAAVTSVELAVEGAVRGYFERRRMTAEVYKLNGHYVLCGFGRVGCQVAREFTIEGVPFVVVENDPERVEECLAEDYLACSVRPPITIFSKRPAPANKGPGRRGELGPRQRVFVVLSARKINPSLHIVARASSDESAAKLEIAGADRTLSPYAVGGRRLASLATQPLIVDFLDIVTRGEKGIEFRLEEFDVPQGVTPGEPHHSGTPDWGEDWSYGPRHPNLGGQVRHHPLRPGCHPHRRHPDRTRRPRPS